jgi:hypothetical protein
VNELWYRICATSVLIEMRFVQDKLHINVGTYKKSPLLFMVFCPPCGCEDKLHIKDGAVYEPILAPLDFLSITLLNHIQGERS